MTVGEGRRRSDVWGGVFFAAAMGERRSCRCAKCLATNPSQAAWRLWYRAQPVELQLA